MTRLIDADELLKHKTDHEMISTHLIYNAPTVDAIPKADYETRLKADLAAMLDELDLRLYEQYEDTDLITVKYVRQAIQQKIDALKADKEQNND